jgi:hypothetical protein
MYQIHIEIRYVQLPASLLERLSRRMIPKIRRPGFGGNEELLTVNATVQDDPAQCRFITVYFRCIEMAVPAPDSILYRLLKGLPILDLIQAKPQLGNVYSVHRLNCLIH